MTETFTPLEFDVRERELVYVSTAKLGQLLLPTEARGGGVTAAGVGVNIATHNLGHRELLAKAGKFFQDQGLLTYGGAPQEGSWLLTRAIMVCGTAWPWAGDSSPSRVTAWWVGSSEDARVIAYGHRDHLLGHGRSPQMSGDDPKATWWPSRADASIELLKEISAYVTADRLIGHDPWGPDETFSEQVEGLEAYFFSNSGVERADPLVRRGVFEMMLRVDRTADHHGRITIAGSPLWVARERRAVGGVYEVTSDLGNSEERVDGYWDGNAWRSFRVTTYSERRGQFGHQQPVEYRSSLDVGLDAPNVRDIISLGDPEWPSPGIVDSVDPHNERGDDADRPTRGWLRTWSRWTKRCFGGG